MNEDSSSSDPEIPIKVPQHDNNSTSCNISLTNGRFFGLASVPILFFALLAGITHLVIYLYGYGWTRNPVEYALGHKQIVVETKAATRLINSHALMALSTLALISLQLYCALNISAYKRDSIFSLRTLHRVLGRLLVIAWPIVAILGAAFTLVSKRWGQASNFEWDAVRIYRTIIFWWVGIASVANLVIGHCAAVQWRKQKCNGKTKLIVPLWRLTSSGYGNIMKHN